jgi:hypothetical protein
MPLADREESLVNDNLAIAFKVKDGKFRNCKAYSMKKLKDLEKTPNGEVLVIVCGD